MSNMEIIPYDFSGKTVRILKYDKGEFWFVAKEVCCVLGLVNSRDAISALDDDEKDDVGISDTIGRNQNTNIISEPGLYTLITRSNKKRAKKFRRWITHEILPSVRKTGSYSINKPDLPTTKLGWMELAVESEKKAQKALIKVDVVEKQNKKLLPKADALDQIANKKGLHAITTIAKFIGVGPRKDLIKLLEEKKVLYRKTDKGPLLPYQYYQERGWFKVIRNDINGAIFPQTMVTDLGLTRLATRFSPSYEKVSA